MQYKFILFETMKTNMVQQLPFNPKAAALVCHTAIVEMVVQLKLQSAVIL